MTYRGAGRWDELARSLSEVPDLSKENIEKILSATEHGQNIFLCGPPGVGKTMIARRIAHAVGGPFRAPHHTVSAGGLIGGKHGKNSVYLGEIGRAQGGTLFLDEVAEFSFQAMEAVYHAYQEGYLPIFHHGETLKIQYPQGPRSFRLVLASSPCPCGYRESESKPCSCPNEIVERYLRRADKLRELCETEVRLGGRE